MSLGNLKAAAKAGRRLRLGMVGGGEGAFIGAIHRMAARLDDRYELVAGALSSDPARGRRSALDLGIAPDRAYGSFAEMARQEKRRSDKIDAVAIVTPNNAHVAPAKAFLAAGIHVICDKPLASTLKEALALAAAVERSGLVFGLTHNYTGHPMVRQAREMVAARQLGRLRLIQVEYPRTGSRPRWRRPATSRRPGAPIPSAAAAPAASAISGPMPSIWRASSPACAARRWRAISRPSSRAGGSTTMSRC